MGFTLPQFGIFAQGTQAHHFLEFDLRAGVRATAALPSFRRLRTPDVSAGGINLVVAVTDDQWFEMLRRRSPLSEVNFWAPSPVTFRALQPGEMFLFKLHAPRNVIVGGGIFAYANALPCSLAWEAFGEANGAWPAQEMRTRIARYRRAGVTVTLPASNRLWMSRRNRSPFHGSCSPPSP